MVLMKRIQKRIEEIRPWTKNFTLYTDRWTAGNGCNGQYEGQCFAPTWECNDPTGECKGNSRWAATFPAGYTVVNKKNIVGMDKDRKPIYGKKFIYDENYGPMVNGECITECPSCN